MVDKIALYPQAVEGALRQIIAGLDYDLHKQIEDPEDGGPDGYPSLAFEFATIYAENAEEFR